MGLTIQHARIRITADFDLSGHNIIFRWGSSIAWRRIITKKNDNKCRKLRGYVLHKEQTNYRKLEKPKATTSMHIKEFNKISSFETTKE